MTSPRAAAKKAEPKTELIKRRYRCGICEDPIEPSEAAASFGDVWYHMQCYEESCEDAAEERGDSHMP